MQANPFLRDVARDSIICCCRQTASVHLDVCPKWQKVLTGSEFIRKVVVGWALQLEVIIESSKLEIESIKRGAAKKAEKKRRAEAMRDFSSRRNAERQLGAECSDGIANSQAKITIANSAINVINDYLRKIPLIEEAMQRYADNQRKGLSIEEGEDVANPAQANLDNASIKEELKLDIIDFAKKCGINLIISYALFDKYSCDAELDALITFRYPQLVDEYLKKLENK